MSSGADPRVRAAAAIDAGADFLRKAQLPHGELSVRTWRPAVPEWVHDASIFGSALVTLCVRGIPECESIRSRACEFISRNEERFGVWRHWTRGHPQFHYVPPDLDDTAMASAALALNGRTVENRRLFLANRDHRGLFFSWISLRARWVPSAPYWWISLTHFLLHPQKSIAFYYITPSERRDVDAVVNANVLFHLGRSPDTEAVVPFLLDVLREHRERTCDKWYDNPFVVWYFFSRALRHAGEDAADMILERLDEKPPETPLELALAASIQLDWNRMPDEAALRALLDAQLASGGWPLAPFYKGRKVRWGSEELTTGFCLEALHRWLGVANR